MYGDDIRKHLQYFHNIEEMEWAIELALSYNKPVAATMCIGPCGDGKVGVPRVTCHPSCHVSRVPEHESRGVRGADGPGGGEDSRGELPVRPLPVPGHAAADEGGSGGCRSPSPCSVMCIKYQLVPTGLSPHLMAQPLGYRTPDVGRFGWVTLPEFPYGELDWCNDTTQWTLSTFPLC